MAAAHNSMNVIKQIEQRNAHDVTIQREMAQPITAQRLKSWRRNLAVRCDECKRRKIKCDGKTPCKRCQDRSLDCIYRVNNCITTLQDLQAFKQMKDQVTTLQDQVEDLHTKISELKPQAETGRCQDRRLLPQQDGMESRAVTGSVNPLLSSRIRSPQTPLPHFQCPTALAQSLEVVESNLSNTNITRGLGQDQDRQTPRDRTRSSLHPNGFHSYLLDQSEAIRLVKLYDEECHIMYPVLDIDELLRTIRLDYATVTAAVRSSLGQAGLHRKEYIYAGTITQLKLVLACALIIDGHGYHELGQKLYNSATDAIDLTKESPLDLKIIVMLVLIAIFHFQKDEEAKAWRFIGIAGRQCLEMGLHRRDSLTRAFPEIANLKYAVRVFWTVYSLDRRWSFGTGMSFSLQDYDIDPMLPEPDDAFPYLKYITIYNRIATKIWQHVLAANRNELDYRHNEIRYLDFQIMQWYDTIPAVFQFDHKTPDTESIMSERKLKRLRFLLFLRRNQARISLYRPILHSTASILINRQYAETVIEVAKDTINSVIGVDRLTDIYRIQQVCYNYFLLQALAVVFLSIAHAPIPFYQKTKAEFHGAIDLIKAFRWKSHTARRIWDTVRGLEGLGHHVSQRAQNDAQSISQTLLPENESLNITSTSTRLAGYDVSSYYQGTHLRIEGSEVDESCLPEHAVQTDNELTVPFNMAKTCGQQNADADADTLLLVGDLDDFGIFGNHIDGMDCNVQFGQH